MIRDPDLSHAAAVKVDAPTESAEDVGEKRSCGRW